MEKEKPFHEERAVDVELASGYRKECVLYEDVDKFIQMIDRGEEDFVILVSSDAFLQFYGVDGQFVGETRIDLPNGDFRTYELIDKEKEQMTQRIRFETPYGVYKPQVRGIVSLEVIRQVVREYYGNEDFDAFVRKIPCLDSTEETKRYMGLKK